MRTNEQQIGGASARLRHSLLLSAAVGIGIATLAAAGSAAAQDGNADLSLDAIRLVPLQTAEDSEQTDLYGDPLPAGALARLGTVRYRHAGRGEKVAFLADNATVVVGNSDSGVRLWDAASGRATQEIALGRLALKDLCVTDDGERLAVLAWSRDRQTRLETLRLKVWDVETWAELAGFEWTPGLHEAAQCVALSPDGAFAATGTRHGWVQFWDLTSGEEILSLNLMQGPIDSLDFSPRGEWLSVAGRRGVFLWKWAAVDKPIALPELPRGGKVTRFSPDGSLLAVSASHGYAAQLYDVPSGALIRKLRGKADSYSPERIEFTEQGRQLAVPSQQKSLEFFDVATGELVRTLDAGSEKLRGVALSPNGRLAAAIGSDAVVNVWDLTYGELLSDRFVGHADMVQQILFLAGGDRIATGSLDGSVRVWDGNTGEQQYAVHHDRWVTALAASRDGTRLLSASFDDTVRLWESGQEVYKLPGHGPLGSAQAMTVAFSGDDQALLSFGGDMYLRIFDVNTGKAIAEHEIRPQGLNIVKTEDGEVRATGINDPFGGEEGLSFVLGAAIFSADAKRLYLGVNHRNEPTLRAFDAATGREVESLAWDGGYQPFATADGSTLLGRITRPEMEEPPADPAQRRSRLHLRTASGDEVLNKELPGSAYHLYLSNDGAFAAVHLSGKSPDRGARFWISVFATATGEEVCRIEDYHQHARRVAFSPDGRRLVTYYHDGSLLVWNLEHFRLDPPDQGFRN